MAQKQRTGLVIRHQPEVQHSIPCAHLVSWAPGYYHWVYVDETGVHDPDPSVAAMPPDGPPLTISVRDRRIS